MKFILNLKIMNPLDSPSLNMRISIKLLSPGRPKNTNWLNSVVLLLSFIEDLRSMIRVYCYPNRIWNIETPLKLPKNHRSRNLLKIF